MAVSIVEISMRRPITALDLATRLAFALAGFGLVTQSLKALDEARLHMAVMGQICGTGAQAPHCAACALTVAYGLAALAAFAAAARLRAFAAAPAR